MSKKIECPPPQKWYLATNNVPVYANACDTSIYCSVPNNYIGNKSFQYARTGNAYIFLDYYNGGGRGYLQSQLKNILYTNKKYYIEYFINIPNSLKFACNNVALLLTNNAVYVDTNATFLGILPANPQVYNYGNPVLGDTLNWTKVSAIYKAQGGEQFITLGNFRNDANTTLKQIQPTGYYGAGYIIDDVSVIPLDSMPLKADAGKDTSITIGDSVFIGSYTNGIDSLKWQLQSTGIKIDSIRPGFWVKPTTTTCYILTQTVNGFTSSDTVCVTVGTVALKLLSYSVISTTGRNLVQSVENIWSTANEINVSHFNIQRSTNSKDFTTIGTQKANNKNYNEYSNVDNSPPLEGLGVVYYRIESIDNDEKKQYSTTQQITINHKQQTVNIYPNPAKDIVNIQCQQAITQIKIINQLGQTIQQINQHQTPNTKQIITLNTKQFAKGLYIVQVTKLNGEISTQKLVIDK